MLLWLEDELREAKAQISRLEQGISEARGQIAGLTAQVHASEDRSASASARLAEIPQVTSQVGQVRKTLTQVEEQVGTADRRLNEGLRLQQIETERIRQELNGTHRRMDLVERLVETSAARFEHLEEADRRLQEAITLTKQQNEALERHQESADLRTSRGLDAMKRYEHEIGRLELDIGALQAHEGLWTERLQAFGEGMRRIEQQNEALTVEVVEQRNITEKIELLRAEIHRVADRVSVSETDADACQQDLSDQRRLLGLLDGKDRGIMERLSTLQSDLATYRDQVADQFHRLHLALDRHRRRQIEELERDLRELKITAFRPLDESSPEEAGR